MKDIRRILGLDFQLSKLSAKDLPVYVTAGREFYRLSYAGCRFILIRLPSNEKFGVIALRKQAELVSGKYKIPVAFEFEQISRAQRDSLLNKEIPFISGSEQIYLPFLGIVLSERFKNQRIINSEKMMPVTQALFLYMLYNRKQKSIIKKDAAREIGVTQMSITRASEQLEKMGLITQEIRSKETHMSLACEGRKAFEKAYPYMINPVQRTILTPMKKVYEAYPLSGESALAERTLFSKPEIPVRAVYKKDIDPDGFPDIDIRWEPESDVVSIEIWKYDPGLFTKDGVADPVSLALCFDNNIDERIEDSIEKYLEGYQW